MYKIILALTFISTSAFAGTKGYDLKMELSMNGKHISSPRIMTKAGEKATVTQRTDTEESFIEVTATEGEIKGTKGILMNFVVGVIGKDGQRRVVSKPQILARENEKAQITVGENEGKETLSLSVIAQPKSL